MVLVIIISVLVAAMVVAMAASLIRNPGRRGFHEHAAVELHRIRRGLDLALFRAQVSADHNRMRRELDRELDELQSK